MHKALILSDPFRAGSLLHDQFANSGWGCEVSSFTSLLGKGEHPQGYDCMVMVVDSEFRDRYGTLVAEMAQIYTEVSKKLTTYLFFENKYEPDFDNWLKGTKRVFQHTSRFENLRKFVAEIIYLEAGVVDITALMSPMNSV